jgi:hypothetical protein
MDQIFRNSWGHRITKAKTNPWIPEPMLVGRGSYAAELMRSFPNRKSIHWVAIIQDTFWAHRPKLAGAKDFWFGELQKLLVLSVPRGGCRRCLLGPKFI